MSTMIIGINPYLITNGNGAEAVAFYKEILGAEVLALMTFAESPEQPETPMTEEEKSMIMHAHLKVGSADLMLSDSPVGMPCTAGDNTAIAVHTDSAAHAEHLYSHLKSGGRELMKIQKTFFSSMYGVVTDRFGVTWHVAAPETE
jgi:PhnB protein